MTYRNLGGMAESKLEEWAHQVGITPNKSKNDNEGWDYLLQFPFEIDTSIPTLDQRASRIECLVQVKGIDGKKHRKSISLSNWERLVRTPLPAFFLVINYAYQNQPSEAYLIHIDKQWIEKVLFRLRKLGSEEAINLHKKTLDLTWSEGELLNSLDGESLREAIAFHIPNGMADYYKEKLDFQKNAGDPIPMQIQTTFEFKTEQEFWENLIDFAIGITENLPTSKTFIQEDIRFGIPSRTKEESRGMVAITRQPIIECKIVFKNELNTLIATFDAELFAPNWFFPGKEIPQKYFKERIVFEIGDAIIHPYDKKTTVNFNFLQANPLKPIIDHANLWRLVLIMNELTGFTLEIVSVDGQIINSGKLDSPLELESGNEALLDIARAVDNAYFIARYFNYPVSKEIHLDQMIRQEIVLSEVRQVCDVNHRIGSVGGSVERDADLSEEVAMPIIRRVIFENDSLLIIVVISGKLTKGDVIDSIWQNFTIDKPRRILQEHLIIPNDDFSRNHVENLLTQVTRRLDEEGIDILIDNHDRDENAN